MPCNSDYMMPSQQEIKRLGEKSEALKDIADQMVYSADVIREIVLKTFGHFSNLDVATALELSRRVTSWEALSAKGDKLVDDIKNEYAYGNDSGGKKRGNKVLAGYEASKQSFKVAVDGGSNLMNDVKLSPETYEKIENDQIHHRMEDVKRLIPIFSERGDFKTVVKLSQVDFTQELEPQLGFSPDDF